MCGTYSASRCTSNEKLAFHCGASPPGLSSLTSRRLPPKHCMSCTWEKPPPGCAWVESIQMSWRGASTRYISAVLASPSLTVTNQAVEPPKPSLPARSQYAFSPVGRSLNSYRPFASVTVSRVTGLS